MNRFTRLTLVGSVRRSDVVVPSDEELAVLLPSLLDLVEEPAASGAVALVRPTGDQLDVSLDADALDLVDGEIVWIVRAEDAPPPAEVADVTEAASHTLAEQAHRWDDGARRATGAAAVGLLAGAAGLLTVTGSSAAADSTALSLAAGVTLLVILSAVVTGGTRWVGLAATAAALGLAPPTGLAAVAAWSSGTSALPLTFQVAILVGSVALGGQGLARRDRGMLLGSVLGLVLTGLGIALAFLDVPVERSAAVLTVVVVALLGMLPWTALTAAGVHHLDDAALEGSEPARPHVDRALEHAYRALTWGTVAAVATIVWTIPALLAAHSRWSTALACGALVVVALRVRPLPLIAQAATLWAGLCVAAVLGTVVALADRPVTAGITLAVAAVLVVWVVGLSPNAQQRARLRRWGDRLELLGVLVLAPSLLGVLGVYPVMLGVF